MENRKVLQELVVLASILYAVHSASTMYNVSVVPDPEHYPKLKTVIVGNYTPRGGEYKISDNLTAYASQNRAAKRVLIAAPDVYGLTANTNMKQIVDVIAEVYNFRVVLPDFFRGHPWDLKKPPAENQVEYQSWLQTIGSYDNAAKYDIPAVINAFQTREKIYEFGMFGMCWGGKVVTLAASNIGEIKASGLVHPSSSVNNSEAHGILAPMYLLPSSGEADMLPFYEVLKQKFGYNSGHKRFDDMLHGFAAAHGNFSDSLTAKRVEEVIDILGGFFSRNLRDAY